MPFAVTSNGFLKDVITTVVDKNVSKEYIWTDKIREAKIFTSRAKVLNFLESNNLQGFVYNPYEQEPIRDKYMVIKRNNNHYEDTHKIHEWIVVKAVMLHRSDARYLNGMDNMSNFYDLEEAQRIANERNNEMLLELTEKIKSPRIER